MLVFREEHCLEVRFWHEAEVSCLRVIRPLYGARSGPPRGRTDVAERPKADIRPMTSRHLTMGPLSLSSG